MGCRVFVSAHGNVFMQEIAEHLVEALQQDGRTADLVRDELPAQGSDSLDNLVVAPHEFFVLFPASEADRQRSAAHAVCVNTEQPDTPFFDLAMSYAALGPVVFDINPWSLASIRRLGLAAVHLPLGVVSSMDHWRGVVRPRAIDIAFMGGATPRREAFLAGAASQLWEWNTELRVFGWHRPITPLTNTAFVSGDEKYRQLADTRIMLNVHRGEEPYFEWARILEAMTNGCAVVSESSMGFEPLVPGEHLVVAPLEYLAEHAVALAHDEAARAAMADAAYELVKARLDQTLLVRAALAAATTESQRTRRRTTLPSPSRVRRPRQHQSSPAATGEPALLQTAATLKRAYLAQLAHTRSIEQAIAELDHGNPDAADRHESDAWRSAGSIDVSVVIPLYRQGAFVAEAIASVAANCREGLALEVIVIDDHSPDDSAETAAECLARYPWLPSLLLRRAANAGLPVVRNQGFGEARGEMVFALDADNVLYPNGLIVLSRHLAAADAQVVAAYGLLERFDERGAVGLGSHLAWEPELLVQGAYIDAMAMFRRDAWNRLGGYATDDRIHGWEDYDLWLTVAEHGDRADLVPRFIGRYREHAASMRAISDIDMTGNFTALRERHPRLPWPS